MALAGGTETEVRLGGTRNVSPLVEHKFGPALNPTGVLELFYRRELNPICQDFREVAATIAEAIGVNVNSLSPQFGLNNHEFLLLDHPQSVNSIWLGGPKGEPTLLTEGVVQAATVAIIIERHSPKGFLEVDGKNFIPDAIKVSGKDIGSWTHEGTGRPFAVTYGISNDPDDRIGMEVAAIDVGMFERENPSGAFSTQIPTDIIGGSYGIVQSAGLFTIEMAKGRKDTQLYPWAFSARGGATETGTGGGYVRVSNKVPFGRGHKLDSTIEVQFKPAEDVLERGLQPWRLEVPKYLPKLG